MPAVAMKNPQQSKIVIGPAHLVFIASVLVFALLLSRTGWTWPLECVAAMLPIAAYLIFT
jgi:hypothetical protein